MTKYLSVLEPAMLVYLILLTLDMHVKNTKQQQNNILTCNRVNNIGLSNIVDFGQVK